MNSSQVQRPNRNGASLWQVLSNDLECLGGDTIGTQSTLELCWNTDKFSDYNLPVFGPPSARG
jgi:hypothetical protein